MDSQQLAIARQRSEIMQVLLREQPGQALRLAFPPSRRNNLPKSVKNYVEEWVDLQGSLRVVVHDFSDQARTELTLHTEDGQQLALHLVGTMPSLQSGSSVRVRGLKLGQDMAVAGSDEISMLTLDGSNPESAASAATSSFGEQRIAVLLVNFQNKTDQPYTTAQAEDLVFNQADAFYRETSSERTWLSGDVFGWYTLPMDQPVDPYSCRLSDISAAAQNSAQHAGVDLSGYDRFVYVFPYTGCFASGTGTVGGTPSESWINGPYFTLKTLAHELGHNLGMQHSGSLDCGDSTETGSCSSSPYGDIFDVMGNQSTGHFNARQKEQLGWLDGSVGEIVTASSGDYNLAAYELPVGQGSQALKVLGHQDDSTGEQTWYYVEYRQATGFDAFIGEGLFATEGNITTGVLLHRVVSPGDGNPVSSLLLDMTPGTSVYYDWYDSALQVGETYTDPASGVSIHLNTADAGQASLSVSSVTPSCVRAAPELQLISAATQWASAGDTVSYQLSLTNRDSTACGGSTFTLSADHDSALSSNFSPAAPFVEAGASVSLQLGVVSDSAAAAAYYDVAATVSHSLASYSAQQVLTYVVESAAPTNAAPVAQSDQVLMSAITSVTFNVLGNDFDPEGAALNVIAVAGASKGSVSINADNTLTYIPERRFKNGDSFSYTISDGEQTASATVTLTLQSSGSDGSGDGTTGGTGGGKGGGKKR